MLLTTLSGEQASTAFLLNFGHVCFLWLLHRKGFGSGDGMLLPHSPWRQCPDTRDLVLIEFSFPAGSPSPTTSTSSLNSISVMRAA